MGGKKDSWLEEFLSENVVGILVGVLLVAIVAGGWITRAYFVKYGEVPGDTASWGQLGDYLGGVLNPVFGFLSVFALLVALVLQTRELKLSRESLALSREELKLTREEQAKAAEALALQNKAIQQQSFEQTFFSMLKLLEEVLQGTTYGMNNRVLTGRQALSEHLDNSMGDMSERQRYPSSSSGQMSYPEFVLSRLQELYRWEKHGQLVRYLRTLQNILELLQHSHIKPSDIYPKTLRSLLSRNELRLIYFVSFENEWAPLKQLVERFGLLRHFAGNDTGAPEDYFSFFERSAFQE